MGQASYWVMSASDSRCSEDDKTTTTKTRRTELRGTIRHASTLFRSVLFSGNRKVCKRGVLGYGNAFFFSFFSTMEALEPFLLKTSFWLDRGMVMTTAIDCLCKNRNTGIGDGWRRCEDCMRVIASVR